MAEKSEESLNDHLEFVAPSNSVVKKKHQIQGEFDCVFVEEPHEQLQTKCVINYVCAF